MTKTYARPQLVDRGSAVEQTLQSEIPVVFEPDTLIPTRNEAI